MLVLHTKKFLKELKGMKSRNVTVPKFNGKYPKYIHKSVEELKTLPFEELKEIVSFSQTFRESRNDFFWGDSDYFPSRLNQIPQKTSRKRLF